MTVTTPAQPASTTAVGTPTLNKKWRVDINLGTSDAPVWTQLLALRKFTPTRTTTTADASTYDSDQWGEDAITGMKWGATGTVLRKTYGDAASLAYDAGQESLRNAADNNLLVEIRYYERLKGVGEAYSGQALVKWEPQGGDPAALSEVNFELLGQGPRNPITNPTT